MNQQTVFITEQSMFPTLLVLLLPLLGFAVTLLILRLATKMQWLTAVAISLIAAPALLVLGIRCLPGYPRMKAGGIFTLLPVVAGGLILLIQLFRWLASESAGGNVNAAERQRILGMVEAGKISTEEGTDLLDAMGRSTALQGQDRFSRLDIAMLCGVALVVLGFFLPWAYIRMPKMPGMFGRVSGYQAGYHVGAIGWAILIVGLLSAIPVFVTPKDFLYKVSMLQIFLTVVGLVLTISVLARAGGRPGPGLIFCLAGFIVGFLSSAAKLKSLAA